MLHIKGYTFALLAAILFGVSTTLNKLILVDVHPIVAAGIMYLSAGILLFSLRFLVPTYILKKIQLIHSEQNISFLTGKDWLYIFIMALMGAVVGMSLFLKGIGLSTATNASLLLHAEVIFTIFLAVSFLHEKAQRKEYVAMGVLLICMIAITLNFAFEGVALTHGLKGNLFILAATFCWAIDNSVSKLVSLKNDVLTVVSLKSLIGGSILLFLALFLKIPFTISLPILPLILIVGFCSIGLSMVFFLSAMKSIGSMKTVVIFSTASLFGLITAAILLNEHISILQIIAGIVALSAVYVIAKSEK
ncbi:DMT family transporter [Candidatus Woesearchaeota archaeon]|nr:DMT family transporter [Candidatus Woesearchaeota archaeon]